MRVLVIVSLALLASCATKQLNISSDIEQKELTVSKHIGAIVKSAGMQEVEQARAMKFYNVGELLEYGKKVAMQKPELERFSNAITMYDYSPGSVYKIYTAPMRVTMLSLEPGEELVAPPQGGDTVRWQINTIDFEEDGLIQQNIIIKPNQDGLKNNMVLTTTHGRTYLLELVSLKNSYMLSVAWSYPKKAEKSIEINKVVYGNYKLKSCKGKPGWQPEFVHDDGEKTYIHFPQKINQLELPALFLETSEEKLQLVNYRYANNTMIIDRLFNKAELRLGIKKPEVVKIIRKDNV
jgi:type IV secretion system protein TrbG